MSKIVDVAKAEVGYSENPKNSNKTKFGTWFGLDGVMWCGIFVSWVYFTAGVPLPKIGFLKGYAGCQTAVAYFREKKMITLNPISGDIVFFDWNNDGRFDHTGIFVKWLNKEKTLFECIEGNTAVGNDSNGGQVMIRQRNIKQALFVHYVA